MVNKFLLTFHSSKPDLHKRNVDEADESLKHSKANMSAPPEKDDDMKNRMLAGMKSFFKNEVKENEPKFKAEKSKKLPKDFANQVLDYEL